MENIVEKTAGTVGYLEFKRALDLELQKAAEGFVKIGYLLRLAMETEILKESGYRDVYEFAVREYNLDKSQVSRFVNINIRFSENGYSDRLQDQYRGYGYAKLAIMLQLPEEVTKELSPGFSKAEIQMIHEEIKEEKKVSDVEVWLEGTKPEQEAMENNLIRVVHQLCHTNPEVYRMLYEGYDAGQPEKTKKEFQAALAPAGEAIYSVRVQGVGRLMLSMKGTEQPVTVINVRSNEKEAFLWEDLVNAFRMLVHSGSWKESWEATYEETLPEEERREVAPVQQKREEKAPAKKQAKVIRAKKEPKKQMKTVQEKPEQKKPEPEKPGQTEPEEMKGEPRQATIETDFQEVLPDGYEVQITQKEDETVHWEMIGQCIGIFQKQLSWPEWDRDIGALLENAEEIHSELQTLRRIRGKEV